MTQPGPPGPSGPLVVRPRRLRTTAAVRRLVAATRLAPADLVLPVFVAEGIEAPRPISSMPGVVQHTLPTLVEVARECVAAGLGGIMLFGVPTEKDAVGSGGCDPDGILNRGLYAVREAVGDDLVIMGDVCLDEFTDHGHCGVLDERGRVDNDATLGHYARMAVAQAQAGAHVVGLSGMMDGQVGAVRAALDDAGLTETIVLAYAVKYASAFYGPFREAVASSLTGDRMSYQQDPAGDAREAARELALDLREGADLVMVKPALTYLDMVALAARECDVPVAAYFVSGEYAMIEAAAEQGWIDRRRAVLEALTSIRRAGADIVLTYHALEAARWISAH